LAVSVEKSWSSRIVAAGLEKNMRREGMSGTC